MYHCRVYMDQDEPASVLEMQMKTKYIPPKRKDLVDILGSIKMHPQLGEANNAERSRKNTIIKLSGSLNVQFGSSLAGWQLKVCCCRDSEIDWRQER